MKTFKVYLYILYVKVSLRSPKFKIHTYLVSYIDYVRFDNEIEIRGRHQFINYAKRRHKAFPDGVWCTLMIPPYLQSLTYFTFIL